MLASFSCSGRLAATEISELAFYLNQAGLHDFEDLALDPKRIQFAGNARRKVGATFDIDACKDTLIHASVPWNVAGRREIIEAPSRPLWSLDDVPQRPNVRRRLWVPV